MLATGYRGQPGGMCAAVCRYLRRSSSWPERCMRLFKYNCIPSTHQPHLAGFSKCWTRSRAEGRGRAPKACPRPQLVTFSYIKSSSTLAPTFAHSAPAQKQTRQNAAQQEVRRANWFRLASLKLHEHALLTIPSAMRACSVRSVRAAPGAGLRSTKVSRAWPECGRGYFVPRSLCPAAEARHCSGRAGWGASTIDSSRKAATWRTSWA